MKISTKGEYGIRAMLFVAMHSDEGPATSHEIATRQGIPEPYLRQILASLAKHRLIQSSRGPQGGHALARPAAEISLRDVLVALEGQVTSVDAILAQPCSIDIGTRHCVIREVFLEVKKSVEGILRNMSLEDLAKRQAEIIECDIDVPLDCVEEEPLTQLRSVAVLSEARVPEETS